MRVCVCVSMVSELEDQTTLFNVFFSSVMRLRVHYLRLVVVGVEEEEGEQYTNFVVVVA